MQEPKTDCPICRQRALKVSAGELADWLVMTPSRVRQLIRGGFFKKDPADGLLVLHDCLSSYIDALRGDLPLPPSDEQQH